MDDRPSPTASLEVEFEPVGRRGRVVPGDTILSAAQAGGVELVAVCGGIGICGTCRIRLLSGDLSEPDVEEEAELEPGELDRGWRLACRARPVGNTVVEVPPESLTATQRLQLEGVTGAGLLDPAVEVLVLQVAAASPEDLRSDWTRLAAALAESGVPLARCSLDVARQCSARIRRSGGRVRVALHLDTEPPEIIALLNSEGRTLGLAVDIGTTKIAAYLVDLANGETLARAGVTNPQISFGDDVVSRIAYANQGEEHFGTLRGRLLASLSELANTLCRSVEARPEDVLDAVIVGNTAMHHLAAGLSVRQLGEAPYVPVVSDALNARATDVGIAVTDTVRAYLPPNIAGYVGADHVAMLLASDLDRRTGTVMALDIGTNTEISLRHEDRLLTCSCASGPAFEGAHIRDGMRAVPGAIERVYAGDDTIFIHTIGDQPPVGICGSGILDAVAVMLDTGALDVRGGLLDGHPLVEGEGAKRQFVLVPSAETGHARDIVVTRADVHEVQLAKGAIRAGIDVLLAEAGIPADRVDSFLVAGAFGTYLDVHSAVRIGMFPPVEEGRIEQIGNAAGMGAIRLLRSRTARRLVEALAEQVEYIELTTHAGFGDLFTDSLFFAGPMRSASPRRVNGVRHVVAPSGSSDDTS